MNACVRVGGRCLRSQPPVIRRHNIIDDGWGMGRSWGAGTLSLGNENCNHKIYRFDRSIDDVSDLMTGVACFRGRAYAVDGQKKGLGLDSTPWVVSIEFSSPSWCHAHDPNWVSDFAPGLLRGCRKA